MRNRNENNNITAVILVGGPGTRISAFYPDIPKPMIPISGKPLLEFIIRWLRDFDVKDLVLATCYKSKDIESYFKDGRDLGVSISYSREEKLQGTAGAIKNAEKLLTGDRFLVVNGDTLFPFDLNEMISFHEKKGCLCTISLSRVTDVSSSGRISVGNDGEIIQFKEKDTEYSGSGLVNGGVYIFEKDVLRRIKAGKKLSLEEDVLPNVVKQGGLVFGYVSDKDFFDIGTPSGYRKTLAYFTSGSPVIIRSRAPMRIAFGGGGTDISPYSDRRGGCVFNSAINKYVYGTLQLRDDRSVKIISADYKKTYVYRGIEELNAEKNLDLITAIVKRLNITYGFELFVRSDVPPSTGLGSSASVAVAVIGLFNHYMGRSTMNLHEIAELAFEIECKDLKNLGGRQDQYASAYGGFNFFEFKGGDFVKVSPVKLSEEVIFELEKNLVLCYIGSRKNSGDLQTKLRNSSISGDNKEKLQYLDLVKNLAYRSWQSLSRGNLEEFGRLLGCSWEAKKKSNPDVTNPFIDRVYEVALKNGAIGGRITGAGGGGHMIFYCYPNKEQEVSKAVSRLGVNIVDFGFDKEGLRVWEVK